MNHPDLFSKSKDVSGELHETSSCEYSDDAVDYEDIDERVMQMSHKTANC